MAQNEIDRSLIQISGFNMTAANKNGFLWHETNIQKFDAIETDGRKKYSELLKAVNKNLHDVFKNEYDHLRDDDLEFKDGEFRYSKLEMDSKIMSDVYVKILEIEDPQDHDAKRFKALVGHSFLHLDPEIRKNGGHDEKEHEIQLCTTEEIDRDKHLTELNDTFSSELNLLKNSGKIVAENRKAYFRDN